MKTVIYSDNDFLLEENINNGERYLHCNVFNWKPSVLKKGINVFSTYLNKLDANETVLSCTKNYKFSELLGGKFIGIHEEDGEFYGVFKWDLKLQH